MRVSWWDPQLLTLPDGRELLMLFLPFDSSHWELLGLAPVALVIVLFALAVTAPLCWALTRNVTAPLGALRLATQALSAGQLDARTPARLTRRKDELGLLAQDFDAMAGRLQALVGTRELLRTIAHELRSPLARLQLAVELARRKDERLDLQLDRIEREGERLDALVGNTLALAKMGALPEPADMLDLAEVVDAVVEDARFEAGDRNVGIAWERPAPAHPGRPRAWPARSRTCCAMRCASRRRAAASACACWRACATCNGNRGSRRACRSRNWAICSSPSTAALGRDHGGQRRRPGPEHRAGGGGRPQGPHLGQQCAASGIERAHPSCRWPRLETSRRRDLGSGRRPASAGPRPRSDQNVMFADTHRRRPSST